MHFSCQTTVVLAATTTTTMRAAYKLEVVKIIAIFLLAEPSKKKGQSCIEQATQAMLQLRLVFGQVWSLWAMLSCLPSCEISASQYIGIGVCL